MHEPDNEQKDNKTKFNDPQTQQPTNKNKHQQRNKCKGITSKRIKRANREQPGLNRWPLDLQSNALPLSYAPPCNWVVILSKPCHAKRLPPCFHLSTPWPLRDNATMGYQSEAYCFSAGSISNEGWQCTPNQTGLIEQQGAKYERARYGTWTNHWPSD